MLQNCRLQSLVPKYALGVTWRLWQAYPAVVGLFYAISTEPVELACKD